MVLPKENHKQLAEATSLDRKSGGTRISYLTALTGATYVVLPKENHMQLTEAATLDRKSGGGICSFTFPATNFSSSSVGPAPE